MLTTEARVLAGALRALITSANTSVRNVAKKISRQHSTLSQWMSGQRIPSSNDLDLLLGALDADEPTRMDLFTLHHNATGKTQPDYTSVALYLVERTSLPASDVADVLDALARCVDVTGDMCATNVDALDLRAISAKCTR